MAKVEAEKLIRSLKDLGAEHRKEGDPRIVVGYTAAYAIYVHEDLEARHPVGQAKFLEQPLREMGPELSRLIGEAMKRGVKFGAALYLAGLKLQAASQLLTPIDTGALRASAFTRLEPGGG